MSGICWNGNTSIIILSSLIYWIKLLKLPSKEGILKWNLVEHSVYIITNKPNGVLYIGLTRQLKARISQHKRKVHPSTFSARYNLNRLVYFETFSSKQEGLKRERQMKKWNRNWKVQLIEELNPNWNDLYLEL
ncbi:MAG: GIY-YIG nuclease family protein [Bacteroidota bacterium]